MRVNIKRTQPDLGLSIQWVLARLDDSLFDELLEAPAVGDFELVGEDEAAVFPKAVERPIVALVRGLATVVGPSDIG